MQIRIERKVLPAIKKLAKQGKRSVSAEANLALFFWAAQSKSNITADGYTTR